MDRPLALDLLHHDNDVVVDDDDDNYDDDYDIYIMLQCVCVSRKIITSNFRAESRRREVSRPLGLVMMMVRMVMMMMKQWQKAATNRVMDRPLVLDLLHDIGARHH